MQRLVGVCCKYMDSTWYVIKTCLVLSPEECQIAICMSFRNHWGSNFKTSRRKLRALTYGLLLCCRWGGKWVDVQPSRTCHPWQCGRPSESTKSTRVWRFYRRGASLWSFNVGFGVWFRQPGWHWSYDHRSQGGCSWQVQHGWARSEHSTLDMLVSIDGVEDVKEMDAKLASKLPALMSLKLNRPKKVQVSFRKTGGLGIKMDWKEKSMGAVISEIHATGLIASWNAEHSSQAVSVGDRFVEFNGKTCTGSEFLQLLKDEKGEKEISLTLLKYWDHSSLREPFVFSASASGDRNL